MLEEEEILDIDLDKMHGLISNISKPDINSIREVFPIPTSS